MMFFRLSVLLILSLAVNVSVAQGDTNYRNPQKAYEEAASEAPPEVRSFTVTSVEKCYKQISREEALEIQNSSLTPYQDCQKVLARKLKEKQSLAVTPEKDQKGGQESPKTEEPATPQFYRVQKSPVPAPQISPEKAISPDKTAPNFNR